MGLSDHSTDNIVAISAVAGADMVEKHIALKPKKGLDIEFSIRGPEIKNLKKIL